MAGDGALFVSGSYVATDLWTGGEATPADRAFAEEVLHYTYDGDQAADRNRVRVVTSHAAFRATSTAMSTISAPTATGSNGSMP